MSKIPADPFVLVDGSSYLFRAYHALPPLTTSDNRPTGAIFGVINMLRKLLQQYQPTHVAVVFDSKGKNFRHDLFEPYKANRAVMPEELAAQIEPLHAIIRAMGIPVIVKSGVEADDIIGTLATQAKTKGWFNLISTGDKDFAQLVDEKTVLLNTMSGELLDRENVIKKFEVPPELIIDYLTLIGDTVDNIPGVPKVGPKTAVKWLHSYGSLSDIIKKADEISGKVGENLRNTVVDLPLYRELITIKVDVELEETLDSLVLQKPDKKSLREWYERLEFRNWLGELDRSISQDSQKSYETVLDKKAFSRWLDRLAASDCFAFDTETNSLDYMSAEIVGLSFSIMSHEAAYVPLAHDYEGAPQQLSREWVLSELKELLEDPNKPKIGHNLKYDMEVLANYGITMRGVTFDTMLESYVLGSTSSRHDLNTLAKRFLNHEAITFEEVAGKGAKQVTFNQVELEKAAEYAAEDADLTLQLHQSLWPQLCDLEKQKRLFEIVEIPLVPVLARMERTGVLIDPEALSRQGKELESKRDILEKEIYTIAGEEFNISSPKQLQAILYEKLKLPILEKTPGGQPSTAEPVLQELSHEYELPQKILDYRSLTKLQTTYVDKLPQLIHPKTGRIHTSYHQAVTSTGRLSSSDPNLQNIPIRTLEGRKIRAAFIASPGYKILAADYSQIELRILAHFSQDPGLLEAFTAGLDVHRSTAAAVFGVEQHAVTDEQRRHAKAINFGLLYGMSAFGLAKQLGIAREEAQEYMDLYFQCFPKVKSFMEQVRSQAVEQGFVETLLGRRLYLPDLKSPRVFNRRAAERAAINAPMQGTNADIIKLSMIKLDQWIRQEEPELRMLMQVHDELVFEVPENRLEVVKPAIQKIMEEIVALTVCLQVGIGVGDNWDEAH